MISEAVGLQPRVDVVPAVVITGGVTLSAVHVTVLEAVAELPQPSTAVNVLVLGYSIQQLVVTAGASEEVTVRVPHASVAVAVPSAALISEATGLQSKG